MNVDEIQKCVEAVEVYGSQRKAAEALGYSLSSFRRRLEKAQNNEFLLGQAAEHKFPAEKVSAYWLKTKEGSFLVKNDTSVDYNTLREQFFEDVYNHTFEYPEYEPVKGDNLLVIDAADVHFGKLSVVQETGVEYNSEIATKRLLSGVKTLLEKASLFGVDQIIFVLGNDILHTDNPFGTTTAGTKQDTDGQWWQAWNAAKEAYIKAIELCRDVANVKLIYCPSNHDYMSGFHLADYIAAWFNGDKHIDSSDVGLSIAHRKYIKYGVNLIGLSHGDGAKETDLPSLMQYECRKEWAETKYAYWLLHHVHHKVVKKYGKCSKVQSEKDYTGVTVLRNSKFVANEGVHVEYVRTPSEPDGWHNRNGYVNKTAIECFLFHHEDGQTARFTTYF